MNRFDKLAVDTIRVLSAEGVEKAKSGHPGLPLGAAPMAYTLWARHMKHNPLNPLWTNRDRFILSAGHGSMLLYSLLHLFGYGLSVKDLESFRQWGSKTPGHPEYGHTSGVETTTGPLGQGIANGVGMALAEAYLGSRFNKPGYNIIDHYTYVLAGDGDMMEGVASEAASLAGTLKLNKLVILYDSNKITIEGQTDIAFREDVGKRFEAYGWNVLTVDDGNDIDGISLAISEAKSKSQGPALIIIKTQIGYGSPGKQGKAAAHGEPLGGQEISAMKQGFGWKSNEPFHVPEEVRKHMEEFKNAGIKAEKDWNASFDAYKKEYPDMAEEWGSWHSRKLPAGLIDDNDFWEFDEKPVATRSSSGEVLNRLAKLVPNLLGGSADLAPSTKTLMKGRGDFSPENHTGSNLHFGVREHAMAAMANGMALYGGLFSYVSTFFVFSDYMRPAIRLAALMGLPVIYVFTHDSIGVGEDGPTHQPVEHLAALRVIPNLTVFRPADGRETAAGWYAALSRKNGPTALVLTRQNLPPLKETGKDALKGAYVLKDSEEGRPQIILMASGSEVQLIYEAEKILREKGIRARVISMPSWELFENQPQEYKDNILPGDIKARLAVEAASSFGWERYTGNKGAVISIDHFGASAPAEILFKEFGFTVENIVDRAMDVFKDKS